MDNRQGKEHEHGRGGHFKSNSPYFFKTIDHEAAIQSGKLWIPKKFAMKYCISDFSGDQHQMVSLEVPSGDVWGVEMKICEDNKLCLDRGWPEFVDFYGIKHCHILVFKYIRRGIFHVHIATEIKYPIKSSGASKDQDYIHFKPQMPNQRTNPQSPPTDEVIRTSSTENTTEIEATNVVGHSENKTEPQMSDVCREPSEPRDHGVIRSSLNPTNPSFTIVMQPSYVHNGSLNVPRSVFVRQLGLKSSRIVKLYTSDGRSWTPKYSYMVYNCQAYCKLMCGWSEFVKDNNVVVGDRCVFELINSASTPIAFHVTIYKDAANHENMHGKEEVTITSSRENTNEAEATNMVGHSKDKTKPQMSYTCRESYESRGGTDTRVLKQPLERASCVKSRKRNPYFSIVMRPSYIGCHALGLPAGFFMDCLVVKKSATIELRTSARRCWTVKYHSNLYNNKRSCKLTSGWRGFVKDNKLVEGDVCGFELIEFTPIVFHVTISRTPEIPTSAHGGGGGLNDSKPRVSIQCPNSSNLIDDGAIMRSCSNPTNPSFSIVMQPSYVHRGIMNVPRSVFVRQLDLKSSRIVKLCTSGGKSWTSKYMYNVCNSQAYCKLQGGWSKFVKDNNVVEGDVCVFKLINSASTPIEFHVTIHKDVASQKNMHAPGFRDGYSDLKSCQETEPTRHTGKRKMEDQILCSRPGKRLEPAMALGQ